MPDSTFIDPTFSVPATAVPVGVRSTIRFADFTGANLTGANLTDTDLEYLKSNPRTNGEQLEKNNAVKNDNDNTDDKQSCCIIM